MDKVTGIKVLRQALGMQGVSRSSIGRALGVDTSQVSRIAAGRFVKLEGHALRVCKYAQSLVVGEQAPKPLESPALVVLISRLAQQNPRAAGAMTELVEALLSSDLREQRRI